MVWSIHRHVRVRNVLARIGGIVVLLVGVHWHLLVPIGKLEWRRLLKRRGLLKRHVEGLD